MEHERAVKVLTAELVRLGGDVFARYLMSKDKEAEEYVSAMEFLNGLFAGKISKDDENYLEAYLKPMWEINKAIKKLSE